MSGIDSGYVPSAPSLAATPAYAGSEENDYNCVRTENSDGIREATDLGAQLSVPTVVAGRAKALIDAQADESFEKRTVSHVSPEYATANYFSRKGAAFIAGVITIFYIVGCGFKDLIWSTEFAAQKKQIDNFSKDSDKLANIAIKTFGHLSENYHTTASTAADNRTKLAQQAETLVGTAFAFASALDFSSFEEVTAFLDSFVETQAEKIIHPDRVALTTVRADLKKSLFQAIVEKLPGFVIDMQAKELTFSNHFELESAQNKMIGYASLNDVLVTDSARNFVTDFKNDPRILGAGVAKATELAGHINALRQFDTASLERRSTVSIGGRLRDAFEYIVENADGNIVKGNELAAKEDERNSSDAKLKEYESLVNNKLAPLLGPEHTSHLGTNIDRALEKSLITSSEYATSELTFKDVMEKKRDLKANISALEAEITSLNADLDRFDTACKVLTEANYTGGLQETAQTNAEDAGTLVRKLDGIIAFFSTTDDRTLETTIPESLSSIRDGLTPPRSGDAAEIQREVEKFLNKKLELAEAAECGKLVEIISQKLGNRRAGSARQTLSGPSIRSSSTRTVESRSFERSQSPNGYDSDDSLDLTDNSSRTSRTPREFI